MGSGMTHICFRVDCRRGQEWRLERCLAIASGIRESRPGCAITFLAEEGGAARARAGGFEAIEAAHSGIASEDLESAALSAMEKGAGMLIFDMETLDENALRSIRERIEGLVVVEDRPRLPSYPVKAIVDPHIDAHMHEWRTDADTALLLGSEFAPLPPEFDQHMDGAEEGDGRARRMLVHFEGSDFRGALLKCAKALMALPNHFRCTLLTGPDYQHGKELAGLVGLDQRFMVMSESGSLQRRLSSSDILIVSPRHLSEALFLRKPAILLSEKDWHVPIAQYASRMGMAHDSGPAEDADEADIRAKASLLLDDQGERERLRKRGDELVDGLGRFRIADELLSLLEGTDPGA